MDTAVLSTLLFNTFGIVVIALGMALAYCLPNRHHTRKWVLTDTDAATRTDGVSAIIQPQEKELVR